MFQIVCVSCTDGVLLNVGTCIGSRLEHLPHLRLMVLSHFAVQRFRKFESDCVRDIGDRCFYECDKLAHFRLGVCSSLERIGVEAFSSYKFATDCRLKEIYIPNGVRELGDRCFENCRELKSIRFGSCPSLVSTGTDAFTGTPLDGVCLEGNLKFRCLRPLHHKR